jgi:hypothetical protein
MILKLIPNIAKETGVRYITTTDIYILNIKDVRELCIPSSESGRTLEMNKNIQIYLSFLPIKKTINFVATVMEFNKMFI